MPVAIEHSPVMNACPIIRNVSPEPDCRAGRGDQCALVPQELALREAHTEMARFMFP